MSKDLNNTLKKERLYVALLTSIQIAHILDFVVLMPLGPELMRFFTINPAQFGLIVSSYNLSAGITGLFFGLIADRFDRKKMLVFTFTGFIFATFLCAISPNYNFLIATRIISGIFGGVINALVLAIVTDLIPVERRGTALSTILASFSITSVVGIPVGLMIAEAMDWRWCFYFICAFSLVTLAFVQFILPNVPVKRTYLTVRENLQRLVRILFTKEYIHGYLVIGLLAFSGFMIFPFLSPYAVHNIGLLESDLKYIYLVGGILTIVSSRIVGKLTDKYGVLPVAIPAMIITLPSIYFYTSAPPMSLGNLLFISSFFMLMMTARVIPAVTLTSVVPNIEDRGTYMGVFNSFRALFAALATSFSGFLITTNSDETLEGFDKVGYISMFITFISIFIILSLYKKHKDKLNVS